MQYDALSRRTTLIDWGGTTTYAYSDRSELTRKSLPNGFVLNMEYDAVGNRSLLIDADSGRFTSTFDTIDRMESTVNPDGRRFTAQYDSAGRRTTLLMGLGSKRKYQYDSSDRLTTQIELNASNNPIITMVDAYDSVGNRTQRVKDGTSSDWTYDAEYRLISQVKSGERATFVYDAVGNIELKWHQGEDPMTMMFDAANRITTIQQGAIRTTVTYDENGNMTEEDANGSRTTNVFDQENRLTVVRYPDATRSTYTYEADGLRRSTHEPGGSLTTMVWDGDDYLHEKS
jgi:YD repeat-containing protein